MRTVVLAVLLIAAVAAGATAEDTRRAQTHFRAGKTQYELGNWSDAIREFAAGYALVPRPEFLLNLGQAYRRAGDPAKAREMFRRYLEKAPPSAAERPQVVEMLAQLDEQLAAPAAPPPPAESAPQPQQQAAADVPVAQPLVPAAAAQPAVDTSAAAPEPERRVGLWVGVAIAVVAVAAAAGVGAWYATRPA